MEIALILKVAGVGILISVLNMILEKVDRKDLGNSNDISRSSYSFRPSNYRN